MTIKTNTHSNPIEQRRIKESLVTVENFSAWLSYDPATGRLNWIKTASSRATAGSEAGTITTHGYRAVRVRGKNHLSHRLAWLLHTGSWPAREIDHINGNRLDNKWLNLREATRRDNGQNLRSHREGKRCGATKLPSGKWLAQVWVNGTQYYCGQYSTEVEAAAVYDHVLNADNQMREVEQIRSTLPNLRRKEK